MYNKVYLNDNGTAIVLDCGTDISDATTVKILVRKPDASTHEWVASIDNNQFIKYETLAGDLDQEGEYLLQAYVESPTWTGKGETALMRVYGDFQ